MEKGKKKKPAAVGDTRDKLKKAYKPGYVRTKPLPVLVAKDPPPQPKLKHQTYFELVENTDRKKQLEFKITTETTPPPGYTFLPIVGNSDLTALCKDLSREQDAMVFMVSTSRKEDASELSLHTCRIGHHFREAIVEEASAKLGDRLTGLVPANHGIPEPIPETQEEINAQADAALRELFPRIPNTDRQEIIDHAFRKGKISNGSPVVGLCSELTLSRRVQLAVLAHIRHRHTRYDQLLRETTWELARKTVEVVCLDIIVRWRGDEENGRDQLDTILREVVVISDSEDDDDDSEEDSDVPVVVSPRVADPARMAPITVERPEASLASLAIDGGAQTRDFMAAPVKPATSKVPTTPLKTKGNARLSKRARKAAKKAQRGFSRYQAAWDQAMERRRHEEQAGHPPQGTPLARSASNGRLPPTPLAYSPAYSPYATQPTHANNEVIYLGPARRPGPTNTNAPTFEGRPAALEVEYSPSARGSRAVYLEEAQVRSTQVMTRTYPNAAFPAQKQPEPRSQDLLVRSIEGPTPTPVSMTPRFVRALPPRKHARDESPDEYQAREHLPPQSYGSSAPVDITQDYHLKRRRVISDHDGIEHGPPGMYPQDGQSRYPPEPTHRVIQARYPPSYATLDREPQVREQAPARPMFYEIRSERGGAARDQPVIVRHSGAALRYADEIVEVRRAVPESRQYTEHRITATEERTVLRHPSGMGAAPGRLRYDDLGYRPSRSDPSQAPRVSMQPIFVRPVDHRSVESSRPQEPIYPPQEMVRAAPEPRRLGQEVYAPHPHEIEPYYGDPRQPHSAAPQQYSNLSIRPQIQPHELVRMGPPTQQPARLSYPHHSRPVAPRDIIVLD